MNITTIQYYDRKNEVNIINNINFFNKTVINKCDIVVGSSGNY